MRDITDIEIAIIESACLGRASRRLALAQYNVHRVNAQMIAAMALEGIVHG